MDSNSTDGNVTDGNSTSVMTPGPTRQPSTGSVERLAYKWVDGRLKVLSVLLPIIFIIALEIFHFMVESAGGSELDGYWTIYRPISVSVTIVSIVAFALVMFRFIDRAQQQVVRQNRELAAMNSVSSAVRGEVGVERIIDVALESVLATSGAAEATVTIFSTSEPSPNDDAETERRLVGNGSTNGSADGSTDGSTGRETDYAASNAPRVIDLPLSTGTTTVGRLRLRLRAGADEDDCLASGTLQNIGHQLASAIQLAQLFDDLQSRKHQGHAFYDVLLKISNQDAPPEILWAVVLHARDLMGSDEAVMCLDNDASRSIQFAETLDGTAPFGDGPTCITSATGLRRNLCLHNVACPVRSSPEWKANLVVPVRSPLGNLGELWVGRRSATPFTERDRAFLMALSGLAAIAITSAQVRESGRQHAVLAERERIAREMHDSLAQVLGVTHLRLRALDSRDEVKSSPEIEAELAELADICEEAYHDVREAILGLRESSRTERGLLDSLRAYLAKYSRQSEIETSLVSDLDHDLALSPRCEVQVIRVIQEALTNVRKHSDAKKVSVRISESELTTTFVVEDDGTGFDPGSSMTDRDGFGLYTMRERMLLLNGSLTVDSAPGRGTRVIAGVPERSHPRPAPV